MDPSYKSGRGKICICCSSGSDLGCAQKFFLKTWMTVGDMGRRGSSRRLTLILVNLAAVLERADEALLPAVYDQVLRSFNLQFSP